MEGFSAYFAARSSFESSELFLVTSDVCRRLRFPTKSRQVGYAAWLAAVNAIS